MKKIKSLMLIAVLAITLSVSFTSCMTTRTSVGEYKEMRGAERTFDKGKQFWVFWGLVPLGRTDVATPRDGNCEVVTTLKFTDFLISGLTGGLITSYSISVNTKGR